MVNKGAALLGRHVTHLTPSHFSTVVYTTGGKVDQLLGQGALGMEFQALGRRGGAQFAALWADRVCGAGLGRRRVWAEAVAGPRRRWRWSLGWRGRRSWGRRGSWGCGGDLLGQVVVVKLIDGGAVIGLCSHIPAADLGKQGGPCVRPWARWWGRHDRRAWPWRREPRI